MKKNLLLSLGINAVLLGVFLCLFTPHYQSNDDFILSCFVNGAIAEKSARMVYINVMIGALLKGLYTLTTAVPWYALMQYVILFASFTAMTWILLQRWELIPALALSIGFVSIFGMDNSSVYKDDGSCHGIRRHAHALCSRYGKGSKKPQSIYGRRHHTCAARRNVQIL